MTTTKERLERKILHAKRNVQALKARESHLSNAGYWDLGYWQGRLTVLEDWLDELKEEEKCSTEI